MSLRNKLLIAGALGTFTLVFSRPYFAGGVCNIKKDLTGQVAIVTGSNTGIGKETARALAEMNATVVLACRDLNKAQAAAEEIKEQTPKSHVEVMKLDLTDLKSIKDFVNEFKSKHQNLNILINNAGVMAIPERTLTKDGFETQFGVNHLGHFYLTNSLLDVIKSSSASRIVNLTSMMHKGAQLEWDNLNGEKNYDMVKAYAQSKFANVVFTKELQKRVADSNVKIVAVHPGVVKTELSRYTSEKWYYKIPVAIFNGPILALFGKTPVQGAQTSLYCALEDQSKLQGGGYYADCQRANEDLATLNEETGKKLWEESEKLISSKISNQVA